MRGVRIARLVGVSLAVTLFLPAPSATAAATGRLAVTSFGAQHSGIFTMNPDGTGRKLVVDLTDRDWLVGGLDLTTDGSMLALTALPRRNGHIYLVNADGSRFHRLTSGGDDGDPSFSPDGDRLVFTRLFGGRHSRLYRIRTDGTGLRRLTGPAEPDANFPSWSPDGSMIAFMEIGQTHQRLVLTNPAGTWFRFLLSRPRSAGQFFTLDWSPDSSTIAFAMYDSSTINADLWTIRSNGTGLTQITDTPKLAEVNPAYSPDGSKLACILQNEFTGSADILVMNADGTRRKRQRTAPREPHLSWGG